MWRQSHIFFKKWFFSGFGKKIYFLKLFFIFSPHNSKSYILTSHTKKFKLFWWILMVFLPRDIKSGQNVRKIRWKRNSFHGHFQGDFSKSCIFPIEEIYQKLWEKYDFYKKKLDFPHENCSFFLLLKNTKYGILHNSEVNIHYEEKGYRFKSL